MSAPTHATFYRANKIVGIGSCNIGQYFHELGYKNCIVNAMDDAWERYREGYISDKFSERYDQYFTTEDDLKNFDHMVLYRKVVPSTIAWKCYKNEYSDVEWITEIFPKLQTIFENRDPTKNKE